MIGNVDCPDQVIDAVAFHRTDLDNAVLTAYPLDHHDKVRHSVFREMESSAPSLRPSGLGILQRLPTEMVLLILLRLDLRTALALSHTNRGTRQLLASLPEYRRLGEHALKPLWALYRTGLAPHVDIATLHSSLTVEKCANCSSFGDFLFLPTVSRCCFDCLGSAQSFHVLPQRRLHKAVASLYKQPEDISPALLTQPGYYTLMKKFKSMRRYLVSEPHALEILRSAGVVDMTVATREPYGHSIWRCMAATAFPHLDISTGKVQRGLTCRGCCVAMDAYPCFDNDYRQDQVYSRTAFLDHFKECQEAKDLWESTKNGTTVAKEHQFSCFRWNGVPR